MQWHCDLHDLDGIWLQIFRLTTDSARAAGLRAEEAAQRNHLGWALDEYEGRTADALREHQTALTLAEEIGDRRAQAWSLMYLSMWRASSGAVDQAVADCRTAMALIDTLDDPSTGADTRYMLGRALHEQGAYPEADSHLRQAEQHFLLAERRGGTGGVASHCLATVKIWRARNLLRLSMPAQAISVADEVVDLYSTMHSGAPGQANAHICAAKAMAELGDIDGALRRLDLTVRICADSASRRQEVDALLTAADLYDRTGQTDAARAHRVRALHVAEEVGGDRGNQLRQRVRTALSYPVGSEAMP